MGIDSLKRSLATGAVILATTFGAGACAPGGAALPSTEQVSPEKGYQVGDDARALLQRFSEMGIVSEEVRTLINQIDGPLLRDRLGPGGFGILSGAIPIPGGADNIVAGRFFDIRSLNEWFRTQRVVAYGREENEVKVPLTVVLIDRGRGTLVASPMPATLKAERWPDSGDFSVSLRAVSGPNMGQNMAFVKALKPGFEVLVFDGPDITTADPVAHFITQDITRGQMKSK